MTGQQRDREKNAKRADRAAEDYFFSWHRSHRNHSSKTIADDGEKGEEARDAANEC